jgi:RNA polymerase II subunit A small phosphatase-like protein
VDTAAAAREDPSSSQSPQLQVQAPTPVVQQDQQEEEMILDRTPEQAARDNDIEMSDSGPSVPLTGEDAAAVVEDEKQAHQRRESSNINREDLPPPPPLQKPQEQHDGAGISHEASMVSTPEQAQKWLLPPIKQEMHGRKCLVLDLDETLVHSSFKVSMM